MDEYTKTASASSFTRSTVVAHIAVMLLGLAGVLGRSIVSSALIVTFGRVFFSSITIGILLFFKKSNVRLLNSRDGFLYLLAGVIMAVHWTLFMASIQTAGVAIGTITFATFPLFVTFLEPVLFHERLSRSGIVQAIIMLLGVLELAPIGEVDDRLWIGIILGMGSSLTYAILSLLNRHFSASYPSTVVCLYEQGIATLVLIPVLLIVRPQLYLIDIPLLIILGVVCTALAHSLFVSSLKKIKVRTAGIISGMETIYSIALAALILGELPTTREMAGGIIILSVALYASVTSSRE